jgi:hypothetical protein
MRGDYCKVRTMQGTTMRLLRKLELGGDVVVETGQVVDPSSLIGHNRAEELLHYLRVEVDEDKTLAKLLKEVGDEVKRGEPVAYYMFMFGLGYREYVSPVNGTLVSFDGRNGLIGIREHRTPLFAGIAGTVEEVIPDYGAVLSTKGTLLEATAGWGDTAWGELAALVVDADATVDAAQIGAAVRGKVAYVGAMADAHTLQACYRQGAKAVIAGGVSALAADEFTAFAAAMTYEEYATRYYSGAQLSDSLPDGADSVPMPVVALEGAGRIPARRQAHDLLVAAAGQAIFVDAGGGCGAAGSEPVVILPGEQVSLSGSGRTLDADEGAAGLVAGAPVRIVGGPHNGRTAVVRELVPDVVLVTGLRAPGAVVAVATPGGEALATVPAVNLELLAGHPR